MKPPDVILELKERGQVVLLAHGARKFGARFSGERRLLHWAEADVTNEAAVVEKYVLAQVAI